LLPPLLLLLPLPLPLLLPLPPMWLLLEPNGDLDLEPDDAPRGSARCVPRAPAIGFVPSSV
jgi:hypothetical protein